MNLTATRSQGELINGATFTGRTDIGSTGSLGFSQTKDLDGVVVALASGTRTFNTVNYTKFGVGGTNRLTIGPNATIQLTGDATALTSDLFQEGVGTIVNGGSIVTGGPANSFQKIDPDVFINQGSVAQANTSGGLFIGKSGGTWTNAATGTIALTGRSLTFDGSGANFGRISVSGSSLTLGGSWDNDGVIDVANATLILGGQYSTDDLGTIQFSGNSSTYLRGILDNTGSVLDLSTLASAQVQGEILGGTLSNSAAPVIAANAVFDGTLIDDDLTVAAASFLTLLRNGARFAGSANVGLNAVLGVEDTIVLDGMHIDLAQGSVLEVIGSNTLTLGPDEVVNLNGRRAEITSDRYDAPIGTVVNQGTIRASNSIDFAISPERFSNEGVILAENQAALQIGAAATDLGEAETSWVNDTSGIIRANASTVTFAGDWANAGSIELTGSTLRLGGQFTFDQIGHVTRDASSKIEIAGELDNRNRMLNVDGSLGSLILAGKIVGGSVVQSGGARLLFGASSGSPALLDGVLLEGDLDLSQGGHVRIVNGSLWTGLARLGKTVSDAAELGVAETRELDGVALELLGDSSGSIFTSPRFGVAGTNTLTLGPSSRISLNRGSSLTSDIGGSGGAGTGTIVNRGTITAGAISPTSFGNPLINPDIFVNDGLIDAAPSVSTLEIGDPGKSWTNAASGRIQSRDMDLLFEGTGLNRGSIAIANGTARLDGSWSNQGVIELQDASLMLAGTFRPDAIGTVQRSGNSQIVLTGVLDNSGGDLFDRMEIGNLTLNRGTIRGGVVSQTPTERILFVGGTGIINVLDGARVTGGLDLSTNGVTVSLRNGATFTGTAEIGYASSLVGTSVELDDVTINLRTGANGFALLYFDQLDLGAGSEINFLGSGEELRGGTIVSAGRITSGGVPTYRSTIRADAFDNQGVIASQNQLTIDCGNCRNFDPSNRILTGGEWSVGPSSRIAVISRVGGSTVLDPAVRINRADVTLSGAGSRFDSLNSLEVNEGTLNLLQGRGFVAPNGFANRGDMSVLGETFETSLLTNEIGASLAMSGTLRGGLDNGGTLSIAGDGLGALSVEQDIVLGEESIVSLQIGDTVDQLTVGGDLSLGGALAISFAPQLASGLDSTSVFELVEVMGAILGVFENIASGDRLALEGGGESFEIRYGEGEFLNRVVAMNFIPEPGTGVLVAAGIAAIALRRRIDLR